MRGARVAWEIVRFDLGSELRRPTSFLAALLLSVGALVAIRMALAGSGTVGPSTAAGGLWVVVLFGMLVGAGNVVSFERDAGTLDGLLGAPVTRSAIALGKLTSAAVQAIALHTLVVPACFVLLEPPTGVRGILELAGSVLLADIGFAAVHVLTGTLSLGAHGRAILGAVIALPLTLPIIVIGTSIALGAWGAVTSIGIDHWLFLGSYDLVFMTACVVLVPEVIVE